MKKSLLVFTALCTSFLLLGTSAFAAKKSKKKSKIKAQVVTNELPSGDVVLLDGFEEGNFWLSVGDAWDQWGSHNLSLDAETTEDWATEGTTSAKWTFDIATAETSKQASFYTNSLIETDWTEVKYLVIDVYNPNDFTMYLKGNVQDGIAWAWSSTDVVEIPAGSIVHNVAFDFTKNGISDAEQIACCIIDVCDENPGGSFYVDNIRIIR